jgi:hypothetical protein
MGKIITKSEHEPNHGGFLPDNVARLSSLLFPAL